MPTNQNAEKYLAHLTQLSAQLVRSIDEFLLTVLSKGDIATKRKSAEKISILTDLLRNSMAEGHFPKWLNSLFNKSRWYATHGTEHTEDARDVVRGIVQLQEEIQSHKSEGIVEAEPGIDGIDFDAIYRQAARELEIPELFNALIADLEAILASDVIDSRAARRELERLLAMIKDNGHKDGFSAFHTIRFAVAFGKNFGFELLEDLPVVGTAVKAFRKTCDDLENKLPKLEQLITRKIENSIPAMTKLTASHIVVPRIGQQPPFPNPDQRPESPNAPPP